MSVKKISLVYIEPSMGQAWREFFGGVNDVEVVHSDITRMQCDAIVSPANSFGFMDGGLDDALSRRFGWGLQSRLQNEIRKLPEGELLIGRALVIPTDDAEVPWLISAPTMRVPMSFNIASSVNAYLAMKAILLAATAHPNIHTIAIPGLCTGVGRMLVETSALQMYTAYREMVLGEKGSFADFGEAQKRHAELNPSGMIWDF